MNLKRYKEIIISVIIILVISGILGIKYFRKYEKIEIANNNINKEEPITQTNKKIEANSYYIENDKLYISYDGENIIQVPGDFYEMTNYEKGSYQISKEKTIFYYKRRNIQYLVYSNDEGKNWNTIQSKNDGTVEYIEFLDKNNGYMYKVKDVAMGVEMGAICKTTDGGVTWQEVFTGINGSFSRGSEVKFLDKFLGFITMPKNGGDSCDLYVTQDGGKSFYKLEVEYIELEDTQFKWTEIYDFYNMPTKEKGKFYLEIGQGADGDYNGGKSIKYYSYNGMSWTTDELNKKKDQEWEEQFDKRVYSRNENVFLKDFGNYQPSNSEIKISQAEAEKIAEIGFTEAATIGEAGYKENQTIRIEEVVANNFFTMNHTLRSKIYSNIKRKCYVFIRENEMGCGAMVYVDVTTGLIIGGQCFGD